MKITKISILNFLGLSAFKTDKLGKLNRITGRNRVGKSAVLKAITEAFKSSGIDPHIIKVDEDRAEILVELDEKILIQRDITPSANRVKVVIDGQQLDKPQTWLNSLIGPFNFNPVDFFLAKSKQRRQILLSAIPFKINPRKLQELINAPEGTIKVADFDYSKHGLEVLTDIQKSIYDRRHEQGLEVNRLKKSIEQDKLDIPPTFNAERYAKFDLQAHIDKLTEYNMAISQNEYDIQTLNSKRARGEQIVDEIEKLKKELQDIQTKGVALKEKVDKFVRPDVELLQTTIQEYQRSQKLINRLEDINRKELDLENVQNVHQELEELYLALTTHIPRQLLSQIKLPVDGLEIKGDDVFIKGVSIEKLSGSEQIKFAVQIARALAGELKVICVDRFECLDPDSRKVFEKEASKDDFEYFMTIVTDGELNLETEDPKADSISAKPSKSKAGF